MAKKMNWRADLQKIRNNREKADNAAKRAEEKAKKLARRQEEAENMGILYVVRSMRPVSYTHLDVYKRQVWGCPREQNQCGQWRGAFRRDV